MKGEATMTKPKKRVGPIVDADFWPKGHSQSEGESQKGEKKMTDVKEEVVTLTKKELEDLITKSTQATIAAMQQKAVEEELKEKESKESEKGKTESTTSEVVAPEKGNWFVEHPKTTIVGGVALTIAGTLLAERFINSLTDSGDDDDDDDYGALVELPK